MFRARLPSIFITSHKMTPATEFAPCRHLTIRKTHATRHVWSAAPATQNVAGHVQSAAPATKTATHLAKTSQKYSACHTKRLSTRCKHVWKSRSATPATRNEATPHVKPPKATPFAELTIGNGHRAITRTVANGCGRLGNVERTHPQPPDPQSEMGTLATHSGKTSMHSCPAVGRC